jgi:hypothetical protein
MEACRRLNFAMKAFTRAVFTLAQMRSRPVAAVIRLEAGARGFERFLEFESL